MDTEKFTALSLIIFGFFTSVILPIVQTWMEGRKTTLSVSAQKHKDEQDAEEKKRKDSLDGFSRLTDQLQEQIDRQDKKIESQDERIASLEATIKRKDGEHDEQMRVQSEEFRKKERGYLEAIRGLQNRIAEQDEKMVKQDKKIRDLENKVNGVKAATDELKRGDTGPLPAQARK